MADQKSQQQQGTVTQQKMDPKGTGRWQFRKNQYRGDGEKKKDPDTVPILKYGPSNNSCYLKRHCPRKC